MMSASSSALPPSGARRFLRPKIRDATFILPKTGQRLKGFVNLGNSDRADGSHDDDQTPLLPQRNQPLERVGSFSKVKQRALNIWTAFYAFACSETGKGVLKCSLAYLIGTMGTFLPPIAAFLGDQDGKHMVATITVYFHPARSRGSMFEASICAFVAFLYATFICVTSMGVSVFFEDILDLLPLGHAIVLIVFCGGGLGFIGWTKQRLGDPLVNVACSLASLAIITVLTKEGAVQRGDLSLEKIVQVLKMIVMGVIAAMAVCFLVFPISAKDRLRRNMVELTASQADMLGIITYSFLSGSEEVLSEEDYVKASNRNNKAYTSLEKLLREAKYEHYVSGTEREYALEKRLVRSVQDVTQSIGGLRSAATLQFNLLKQPQGYNDPGSMQLRESTPFRLASPPGFSPSPRSPYEQPESLTAIVESPEGTESRADAVATPDSHRENEVGTPAIQGAADIFGIFITHLGPSMRSLAFTLKEILAELHYGPSMADFHNSKFRTSLNRALDLYRSARNESLELLYRQREIQKISSLETEADLEEVAASCGHFSFSLQEFAEQLKGLLDILDEIQLEIEERPGGRSWEWLKPWRSKKQGRGNFASDSGRVSYAADGEDVGAYDNVPYSKRLLNPSSRGTEKYSANRRMGYRIWNAFRFFRREDTKFAVKVGVGAAMFALPSFLTAARPIYKEWRGEWGLLSYMLVCSMTIGASNTTGLARFSGTALGALCAITCWHVTFGNVFGLAVLGWVMSLWTSYIILARGQGPMGRFIMLTYNLSVLYAYSLSLEGSHFGDEVNERYLSIAEITLKRVVAVFSGCVWGIIITRVVWPTSARKKLKDGLSLLWLRMSLIWKRDPLSMMADTGSTLAYFSPAEKLELQQFLSRLEALQGAAKSELELRAPFPDAAYSNILNRTRRMLDAFNAMNLEINKNLTSSEGEAAMLKYTRQERVHLSARISHLLSVLASSMKLEYPLNDVLPNTQHARDRLLARMFQYRKDEGSSQITSDEDYALIYAYTLVTGQLCNEILEVISEVSKLFGVLNEDALKLR
ncbi:hypothetical protein FQN54_000976 [Arachnomyces sp. PD_36]|nr:hypothetical protein FQN54_000976 [Arachnomyces sp. PD_36]